MMFLNRLSFRFSNRLGLAILLALAVAGVGSGLLWGLPLGQANAVSPFLVVEDASRSDGSSAVKLACEGEYSAPAGIPVIDEYSVPEWITVIDEYSAPARIPVIDEYSVPEWITVIDEYSAPARIPVIDEYSVPEWITVVIEFVSCDSSPGWIPHNVR